MSPTVQQWAGSGADFPTHSSVQQSCVSEVPDLLLGMHPENLKLLLDIHWPFLSRFSHEGDIWGVSRGAHG